MFNIVFLDKVEDSAALQTELKAINGVIETSLFTKEVTAALVAGSNGIKVISK
jgi:ribose 5-phosphate isomerase A